MIRSLQGDCRDILPTLPSGSVHCVVTSPPYYGLRDYGVAGQLGLEPTPDDYIATMVAVFREVRRVLRDDGTVFLNIGDSYAGYWGDKYAHKPFGKDRTPDASTPPHKASPDFKAWGIKPKDLLLMPARLALALQQDGWWIRSDIIWAKPNPMPESVTDRPTSAHEHVFLLSKSARYYYDADAVREEPTGRMDHMGFRRWPGAKDNENGYQLDGSVGRNLRNVWTIATHAYPEAHFATFPPELAERCIRAGTSERGCCAACGAPWVRVVERIDQGWDGSRYGERAVAATGGAKSGGTAASTLGSSNGKLTGKTATTGWSPGCQCGAATVPAVVLDPFAGAGTSLLVADRLQRDGIAIELSPAYCAMLRSRITNDMPLFTPVAVE